MIRRTYGLKVLGVSLLAALGLMAVTAVGAQANWEVEGAELKENAPAEFTNVGENTLVVEKQNFEIKCTTVKTKKFELIAKSGTAEGEDEYSGCKTFSPIGSGKESKLCNPINQPIILAIRVLLILHNGINYMLLEPRVAGGRFSKIEFSELCALTESSELLGTSVDECGHLNPPGTWLILDCANSQVLKLVRPAPIALFPLDVMRFGANPALPGGETSGILIGPFLGRPWGGRI
jgi:hypothetical protein